MNKIVFLLFAMMMPRLALASVPALVGPVEESRSITFDLFYLDESCKNLAGYVYRDKKLVLENLAKTIEKFPVGKPDELFASYKKGLVRIFSMYVIEGLLQEIHSDFIQGRVLPALIDSKTKWSQKFDVSNIQDIELSRGVLEVSFALTESGLQASKNYLSHSQQQELDDLMVDIAQAKAMAESTPRQSSDKLAAALDQHQNLLMTLLESERTIGFGKMILEIQSYLKGQTR